MTTLVVQAHPVPDSFNAALLKQVIDGLDETGADYRVMRLAQGDRPGAPDLAGVERLVLVYPTWSGGQPALLLDWLQEMLLETDAFASIQNLLAVTSLGSTQFLNKIQGEWGRMHLSGLVLDACASGATFEWLPLYKIDRQPAAAIEAHLTKVNQRFARN